MRLFLLFLLLTSNLSAQTTDPFTGTFTISANGQAGGWMTISKVEGSTYQLTNAEGSDNAILSGGVLGGTTSGVPFTIKQNGNNLEMELLGVKIDLIRQQAQETTAAVEQSPAGGAIDPRLIGVWSNTSAYNSGGAGTSSQTLLAFYENGAVEYQYSFSAGGDGWSAGKTTDPVERGAYTVSDITENGGTVTINGQAAAYEFYVFDGERKLIFGNKKTPWVKVR